MKRFYTFILFLSIVFNCKAQWASLFSDTSYWNSQVCFLNKDTGFVASYYEFNNAYNGIVLRTLDGGSTWDTTIIPGGIMILSITFPNDTIGYCGGQDGGIYKTTDMGQNWYWYGNLPYILDDYGNIFFRNKDTGFVNDDWGHVYKTVNGGTSWNTVNLNPRNDQNYFPGTGKFYFVNDTLGFLANGNHGHVLKTNDGGNNWSFIDLPDTNDWAMSISMLNRDTGFVVCQKGRVYRTLNSGTSWQLLTDLGSADLMDIDFFSPGVGYIVGGHGPFSNDYSNPPYPASHSIIYKTSDGGNTWSLDDSLCCDWLTSVCHVSRDIGYCVGGHGRILKINNASGIHTMLTESELAIYPDPVIDIIHLSCVSCKYTTYEIYNAYGQKVLEGKYRENLDVENIAQGIYFLRLISTGDPVTCKFVKVSF
ncbi:MAG TPA: YCF48-related protein [Bacteroidia bacterium]|jgi:photosystem II stability/assembly factor-like uncharacterized protein